MFFTAKKEEIGAINLFKQSCIQKGISITLSERILRVLQTVVEDNLHGTVSEIANRDSFTLGRRGLVRDNATGEVVPTELGLLVAALAEAGGLISIKGKKS